MELLEEIELCHKIVTLEGEMVLPWGNESI
jgi:hypothetical protein